MNYPLSYEAFLQQYVLDYLRSDRSMRWDSEWHAGVAAQAHEAWNAIRHRVALANPPKSDSL